LIRGGSTAATAYISGFSETVVSFHTITSATDSTVNSQSVKLAGTLNAYGSAASLTAAAATLIAASLLF